VTAKVDTIVQPVV